MTEKRARAVPFARTVRMEENKFSLRERFYHALLFAPAAELRTLAKVLLQHLSDDSLPQILQQHPDIRFPGDKQIAFPLSSSLMGQVLNFLDTNSRFTVFNRVCRLWRLWEGELPVLHFLLTETQRIFVRETTLIHLLPRLSHVLHMERVKIGPNCRWILHCQRLQRLGLCGSGINHVVAAIPSVTRLDLRDSDSLRAESLLLFPNLVYLQLPSDLCDRDLKGSAPVFEWLQKLRRLSIPGHHFMGASLREVRRPELTHLEMHSTLSLSTVAPLAYFNQLECLSLPRLEPEQLVVLDTLPCVLSGSLRALSFTMCPLHKFGVLFIHPFKNLGRVPSLRLSLYGGRVHAEDAHLEWIGRWTRHLEFLDVFSASHVSDDGLAHLALQPKLAHLILHSRDRDSSCGVSSSALSQLTRLQTLKLANCPKVDLTLQLPQLTDLTMDESFVGPRTQVSDWVVFVSRQPKLRVLTLHNVGNGRLDRLQKACATVGSPVKVFASGTKFGYGRRDSDEEKEPSADEGDGSASEQDE